MSLLSNGNGNGADAGAYAFNAEQIADLEETFKAIDLNGDGAIQFTELQAALKTVGLDLPGYEVRDLISKYQKNHSSNGLSLHEFSNLYSQLKKEKDIGQRFKESVAPVDQDKVIVNKAIAPGNEDIFHTVRNEEQVAFSDWINTNLGGDSDLQRHLPISSTDDSLYTQVGDGLVICKLINLAVPETIDERAVNKKNLNAYTKRENLTLALTSAQAIGCNIVNIDADDLAKGKPHLVLGLLWQIIRIGLLNQIDLVHVPGLVRLLRDGETLADLQKMSPEEILIRWVNYHMENAGIDRRLNNFTGDIKDSEIYSHLLNQIAPKDRGVTLSPLNQHGNVNRAEAMLQEAEKLDARSFVTKDDVANGNYKLNLAFTANLFNTWPGLKPPGEDEELGDLEGMEETREEKTYRNWMNSMGVNPFVNWLYSDLSNGVVIFQLYDVIRKGIVDWKRVVQKFRKIGGMMDQIENCNYAVDLGKQLRFSLVGIQGKDIYDGNRTLTLGLVWQLMRAYTLTLLSQCTSNSEQLATDKEIVDWTNKKLESSGKSSRIRNFQDSSISNGRVLFDLIDAIQPGIIQFDLFRDGASESDKLANAKYAITSARKMGAKVYALPEDIVEVKSKMVMTVFACLMARDFMPNMKQAASEPITPLSSQ